MTQQSNFPLRATRVRFLREIGATFHDASWLAARHKTAVASNGGGWSLRLAGLAVP